MIVDEMRGEVKPESRIPQIIKVKNGKVIVEKFFKIEYCDLKT